MKRVLTAALVTVALVMGAAVPAEASVKHTNWLRACGSKSCVVEPIDVDHLRLQFRTSSGHLTTVHSKKRAWRIVTTHSHRCKNQGSSSCYMRDDVTGLNFIVFPSGLHVALKRVH